MIAQALSQAVGQAVASPCPEVSSITWPMAFVYMVVAVVIGFVALFKL